MPDSLQAAWDALVAALPAPAATGRAVLVAAVAVVVYASARHLARAVVPIVGIARRHRLRPARLAVIVGLVADAIRAGVLLFGLLYALTATRLVERGDLVWILGLLSAGIGLAARPVLTDYLHGLAFIFGDTLAVGEKVHLPGVPGEVEGTIEQVGLRALSVRAQTGELFIVPNGEVRVIRNFGRGLYSMGSVHLRVPMADVDRAVALLNAVKPDAIASLPELLEPWRVISPQGTMGAEVQLTVVYKTAFGQAAELRPRLLGFLQRRLADADIPTVG